ncbi:uracil-DNA glycosylase family protein [Novosphingobium sp.]|uniref:uracil-DNA glycosylase family protein n=1 Tax=Novosphingobium sp. TaxID=1874826 RepID=UPI00262C80B4|nr:uracil-DNA glycosylase family protein [Novosphingobium sp.]
MEREALDALLQRIRACSVCAPHLPLGPRPIVQAAPGAAILIIGQAPGTAVHASGIPWDDPSGDRLREWTGLDRATFYDPGKIAQMPMGFCYPGKVPAKGSGSGGDAPPRRECAPLWHEPLRAQLVAVRLTLLVGQYAQATYAPGRKTTLTERVRAAGANPAEPFALPHPSWRSTMWMRRNPWFEADVLPLLRVRVREALRD